jgi:hypothetical protein
MERRSYAILAVGLVLLSAGCLGFGGSGPTSSGTTPTDQPQASPTPDCEQPTPEPVPDVQVINRLADSQSVSVTVTPQNGGSTVFSETVTVPGDEEVDRYEVVPDQGEYLIEATHQSTTETATMEMTPGDRYNIVTVIVQDGALSIERLGVHPGPTPTPCSA